MTDVDAWDRDARLSCILFFSVLAATEAFILLGHVNAETLTSAAVLALALPIYLLLGKPALEKRADAAPATSYLHAIALVYVFAAVLDITALIMLTVVATQTFKLLPLRRGIVEFLALTLVPLGGWAVLAWGHESKLVFPTILTLLISVLGVVSAVWVQRIIDQSMERSDLIGALEASHAEIRRLSVGHGVLLERARLAREIHDTLAQGFTSVVTLGQAAGASLTSDGGRDAAKRHVELIVRTATDNLAECRALLAASSSPLLSGGTLRSAIQGLADRLRDETGLSVTVDVEPGDELPEAVAAVGLRVTQEALSNIRKHAQASSVSITLVRGENDCTITVTDDGRGFDPLSGPRTGFGLQGMQSRVAEIGGLVTITSGEGARGTTVSVWLPTTADITTSLAPVA